MTIAHCGDRCWLLFVLPLLGTLAGAQADPVRNVSSRYTSLKACELIRSAPDEAGYYVALCPGIDNELKLIEADGRQDLALVGEDESEQSLHLVAILGSGFSSLGPRAEWRGTTEGGKFRPTALIVRYDVVEDPDTPERPTSYLVAIQLTDTEPCVTGKVPPRSDQNEVARRLADAGGTCLPVPG